MPFNGVDTSDHTYNFLNNEMSKMGKEGKDSVFERHNHNIYNSGREGRRNGDRTYDQGGHDNYQINKVTEGRPMSDIANNNDMHTAILLYDPNAGHNLSEDCCAHQG